MPVTQYTLADESHMRTLSVLHFVLGGFGLLGIVFLIIHFALMATIFTVASKTPSPVITYSSEPAATEEIAEFPETPEAAETLGLPEEVEAVITTPTTSLPSPAPVTPPAPFPKEAMWIMIAFYVFFGVMIIAFCVCNVLSGMWIRKRKNRTFSFVVAAMNCIQFPFGTALGVFTFIVLARPTVQMTYEANRQV